MITRFLLAAVLAVTPVIARAQGAAPAPAAKSELREGKRFTVLVEGSGPDVVLIPGLATPRAVWDGARERLRGRYRLHLVQVRGFGDDAGRNASGPVLAPLVKELADYIDDTIVDPGARPPAIVGHSLGGLVGLEIALSHPELVGRLMVVDALPFFGTLMGADATVAGIEPRAAAMRDAIKASPKGTAAGAPNMSITPAGQAQVAAWGAAADPAVVAQALYDDLTTDLRPRMGGLTTPTTLLYPISAAVPAAVADPLYRGAYAAAPHVRTVAVPGSYHFIMNDQATVFMRELDTFLTAK